MPATYSVKVVGLKEAIKAIKEVGAFEDAAELKAANLFAAQTVATKALTTAPTTGRGQMGHIAAGSIRARASQRNATVAGGGARIPWFGGMEFGSHQGPGKTQFPAAGGIGYNIYPAIISERSKYVDEYEAAINKVIVKYGLA